MPAVDSDLVQALHEGMFEQPLWYSFLDQLLARTGALATTLTFRPIDEDSVVELRAGKPLPAHPQTVLFEQYARDPLPYRAMREGRVYSLEEMTDASDPVWQSLRRDLLAPHGITSARSVRVTEPSGVDAWLSCVGGRNIGSAISALLAALAPHLRVALRTYIALERERFRSVVTSDAIRRLNFGWLTLDARGRIVDMAPHVEQVFQRTSLLRRGRYDRLTPASPAVDRELTALVRRFAEIEDTGDNRPKAINLSRDPWMDMLVAPMPGRAISAGPKPVAIVYLSGDRRSQADRCEQLVDLFGLLPSEARLAWALARGMSIAQAAEDLGLTIETARTYSKKIYAKTGAGGQADLVRTILTSVLAFA